MTGRRLGLAVAIAALAFAPLLAQDAPHWQSTSIAIDCTSQCHVVHHAAGSNLTQSAGNVNLCQSCHRDTGLAGDLPVDSADAAVPGMDGIHHAFDVAADNPQAGAQAPADTQRNLRVMGGNIVCSTCHNQHKAESTHGGESRIDAARRTTALGSTGDVISGGTFSGAAGVWYLVDITLAGTETSARFRYSKDNGISWFPSGCEPDPGNTGPCLVANGASPVALDSGVEVTFSGAAAGSFLLGEQWEFSGSWQFLRRTLPLNQSPDALIDSGDTTTGDVFCRDCHRSWALRTADVRVYNSGAVKSHPVGVAYPSAGTFYHATPLDGNGAVQGGAGEDANPTNDLRFDAGGFVQCLSCHGVHYVDSNTQTVDGP